jgi:hypothetical protein
MGGSAILGFAAGGGGGAAGDVPWPLGVCSWASTGAVSKKSKHPRQRIFRKYDGILIRESNTVFLLGHVTSYQ